MASSDDQLFHMTVERDAETVASGLFLTEDEAVGMSLRWLVDIGPLRGKATVAELGDRDDLNFSNPAEDQVIWWMDADGVDIQGTITRYSVGHLRLTVLE